MTIPRRANVDAIYELQVVLVVFLHNSDLFDVYREEMMLYRGKSAMVMRWEIGTVWGLSRGRPS